MQRKNIKAIAALCGAVPVIAIAVFLISRSEKDDAPGLYISDSTASAVAQNNDGDGTNDPEKDNGKPHDAKNNNDPTDDDEMFEGDTKEPHGKDEDADNSNNTPANNGKDGGETTEKPNTKDAVSNNTSAKDSSDSSKKGSADSKADTSSKKSDNTSKKSDTSSKRSESSSSAAPGKSVNSKAADKTSSAAETVTKPPEESEIPREDVKYTYDTLEKMVDGNFSISTSGHINYMVNANVSGMADYNGADTHIKVESPDFPAVNSDTYTRGGEMFRVVSPENATYSHNASIVGSFIDFGSVFEKFAAQREYLIPLECTTEGGVTTEKFSFTYYDELCYYDYLTLIITVQYDSSGIPFSLHVTTNEDYGYEEIYQSDSLSFSESVGGVDIPDFSGWTCVDNPPPTE